MERSSLELALKRLPATSYRQVAVGIIDTRKNPPKQLFLFLFWGIFIYCISVGITCKPLSNFKM